MSLSVHLSVLLSVLSGCILGIGSLVFSETLYGVRDQYGGVRDSTMFLERCPSGKNGQKLPKNNFFDFLGKTFH